MNMGKLALQTIEVFRERFHGEPEVVAFSPARVDLLGNHTDYNDGFTLTLSLDRYICVVGRKTDDGKVTLFSANYDESEAFDVNEIVRSDKVTWGHYVKGVITELQAKGIEIPGFDAAICGDIPLGTGLSSSAALEVATAMFLREITPYTLETIEIAKVCQKAENNFVGAACGILDQCATLFGKKDHGLFLDCRTLETSLHGFHRSDIAILICNTGTKHNLANSKYLDRRRECEAGAQFYNGKYGQIQALRDVSLEQVQESKGEIDSVLYKRALHVVTENQRVLAGVKLLDEGKLEDLGELMNQSHESSVHDFDNSCDELNIMVEGTRSLDGVIGTKLCGAGFGGCTIALVQQESAEQVVSQIKKNYLDKTGISPEIHIYHTVDGASAQPCSTFLP